MADNLIANPGSGGATFATDDVAGVHYPIGKLAFGALDSVTLAASGSGTITAGTLRVVLATDQPVIPVSDNGGSLTVDGTVAVSGSVAVTNAALSVVGGGVEATALRVTIASDSTGLVSVDDNGGSLTVDGTVAITVGTGATDLGKAEDAVHASGDTGVMILGVRNDAAGVLTSADGDYSPVRVDSLGNVVTVPRGQTAHDGALAGGASAPLVSGGWASAAAPADVSADGDAVRAWHLRNGAQAMVLTAAGALIGGDAANGLDIDVTRLPALVAGSAEIGRVRITDGTDLMDVFDLTNSNPAAVAIVDANGDQITSFGGGTQYTEDVAAATDPIGTAQILVRQDTPAALVTTDGDNVARRGTNFGAAYTQILTSAGAFVDTFGGGSQFAVDAVAGGTDQGTLALVVRDDALAALTPADGDYTQLRVTSQGRLWVSATIDAAIPAGTNNIGDVDVLTLPALPAGTNNIGDVDVLTVPAPLNVVGGGTEAAALRVTIANDSTGVLSVDDNGGSLTVDGTVAISGTVTVDTEFPAAETPADNLTNATAAPRVNSLNYVFDGTAWDRALGNSTDGALVNLGANNDVTVTSGNITADTELPAAAALADNTANPTTTSVGALGMLFDGSTWDRAPGNSAGGQFVQGNVTSDTPITANPLLAGGRASTATPAAMSADGDAVALWLDRNGAAVVRQKPAATPAQSSVAGSVTSVSILAANTGRLGATVFNDSTSALYLKLGATASATSYTVKMFQNDYFETPFGYTGAIDGIWDVATGNARITEVTV